MKQGLSRNPGGGRSHPALIKGKGTTMAAKKKNTTRKNTASKSKNPASHNPRVPAGFHLAKNRSGGQRRHHSRNPFNMSGDFVKVAVATIAAIGVTFVAPMIPINQANPIVRGAVKAAIGVAGSVLLGGKNAAIAEGVLLGCGVAGGLDIASGVLPGLGGSGQQMLIQVPQNPSQVSAGSPGGLTPTTAKTVGAIRRQMNGMRGIRMVTGNPAMFSPYQYAA